MLDSYTKQKVLRAIYRSDLKRSQKRDLASKVTSPSATPQSVGGLLTAAGLGAVGAGIFGFAHVVNEYTGRNGSTGGGNFSDLDPSVDATQHPEGSHNENPIGNRQPNNPDSDRSDDGAVTHIGFDGSISHSASPLTNGKQIVSDRLNPISFSNPDITGDRDHAGITNPDSDSGLFGGLGLGGLIDAIANRFLDFELTGGEREANEFTAEQNRLANEFSAQQAEISRDWQEQMYQKYNSLQGKIAQAEEAGVNPMFALGSGVTPTGFSSSSPSGHAGSSVGASPALNGQLPALLQSVLGIVKLKSDIAKTNAETGKLIADTNVSLQKLPYEIEKLQSSTGLDKTSSDLNLQKIIESATSVEKIKVDMNLSQKQAELFAQQINYISAQASYINSIKDHEVSLKEAQASIASWQNKNKELFKGLEVGADVVGVLTQLGLGIFNAKTGRIIANNGLPVQQPLTLPTPN